MLLTFSEFGRRVAHNASGGTDHGADAPLFFFGGAPKGGFVGKHPSVTDFRGASATLLNRWQNTPSTAVLGRRFWELSLLRSRGCW